MRCPPAAFVLVVLLITSAAVAPQPAGVTLGRATAGESSEPQVQQVPGVPRPNDAAGGWVAVIFRLAVIAMMAVLLVAAGVMFFEDRFIFRPSRQPLGGWDPPGLGVEDCAFRTRDGMQLHGWWHPGQGPEDASPRPVLLWCHGHAGNITHGADLLRRLVECGLAVFLFDYRGYGKSEGRPSEQGLCLDAEAAYRYLVEERKVSPKRIICFGRSLGCTAALHVALLKRTAGLVMEDAFENVAAVVKHRLHGLPLAFFVRNRFDNVRRVRRLRVPLLVIHGSRDSTAPVEQARAVFNAASKPKEFHVAKRSAPGEPAGDEYCGVLRRFCDRCVAREPASPAA